MTALETESRGRGWASRRGIAFGAGAAIVLTGAGAIWAQDKPADSDDSDTSDTSDNKPPTLKELQDTRFPQPVPVGELIGWPVIAPGGRYRRLGVVVGVYQPKDDDPQLVFRYGGFFGWGSRLIAPPLDAVALVGPMVKIDDLDQSELDKLPTFQGGNGAFLGAKDVVHIGVDRKY